MKKSLLLGAALFLGTCTTLFAQALSNSEFTVRKTYDVGEGADLGFYAISSSQNVTVVNVDFTYNGTDPIEFFVVVRELTTYRWLEGYAQTVVPSPEPQTLTWVFEMDGLMQDTQTPYPDGYWPLVNSENGATPIYDLIVTSQADGIGGGAAFNGANTQWKDLLVVGAETRPLSTSKYDFENGFGPYPNPVTSNLNVKLPSAGNVEIISLTGKVLISKKVDSVDTLNLDSLSSGMYIFRYTDGSVTKISKLVKE